MCASERVNRSRGEGQDGENRQQQQNRSRPRGEESEAGRTGCLFCSLGAPANWVPFLGLEQVRYWIRLTGQAGGCWLGVGANAMQAASCRENEREGAMGWFSAAAAFDPARLFTIWRTIAYARLGSRLFVSLSAGR